MPSVKSTNNKRLLILAASLHQLPYIRYAKSLGVEVVTLDNRPDNPGHALADRSYDVDTTDITAVLAVARAERIEGVLAAGTDVALHAAAAVAEELGLIGPSRLATSVACDKTAFRTWQGEHGFAVPESHVLRMCEALPASVTQGKWVIKPDRSSGSKGIFIVSSEAEIAARLPESLAYSPSGKVILERYLPGRQVTCEGVLKNGRIAHGWITDRQVAAEPYTATAGHRVPTRLAASDQTRVLTALERAWALLGVARGPFDCDAVVSDDEVYLLEITPRPGGNAIGRLLDAAYGFDMVKYAVRNALDLPEETALPEHANRAAAVLILGVGRDGRLAYDAEAAHRLSQEPWFSLSFDCQQGERVQAFRDGRNRVGEALVTGRDRDEVDARIQSVRDCLNLHAA